MHYPKYNTFNFELQLTSISCFAAKDNLCMHYGIMAIEIIHALFNAQLQLPVALCTIAFKNFYKHYHDQKT